MLTDRVAASVVAGAKEGDSLIAPVLRRGRLTDRLLLFGC